MKQETAIPVGLPEKQQTNKPTVESASHQDGRQITELRTLEYANNSFEQNGLELPDPYLPELKIADYEIIHVQHKKGEKIDVIDFRTALFAGLQPKSMMLEKEWMEMVLSHNGERSRSTHPYEVFSAKYAIDHAHGHTLVSGLGIGLVLHFLGMSQKVQGITCVEADQGLIDSLANHFPKVTFVNQEVLQFMEAEQNRNQYDFVYLDVDGDSEFTFYDHAAPQMKAAKKVLKQNFKRNDLVCWHEEVMRGQIIMNIIQAINDGYDPRTESAESLDRKRGYMPVNVDFFERYGAMKPSTASNKLIVEFVWQWEPSESSK